MDPSGVRCVDDLFDAESGGWDMEIIDRVFDHQSVEMVKRIPFPNGRQSDQVRCVHEKNGELSVLSAYGVAFRLGADSHGVEASTSSHDWWFWRQLWRGKVLGKTKHLVWRACHNILPARANLHRHNIVSSNDCPLCHQVGETITHALWGCPYARDVWSLACLHLQKSVVLGDDFMDIARYLVERLSTKERDQWMAITWALWVARNMVVFEDFSHTTFKGG
jgi:hypothetical protein